MFYFRFFIEKQKKNWGSKFLFFDKFFFLVKKKFVSIDSKSSETCFKIKKNDMVIFWRGPLSLTRKMPSAGQSQGNYLYFCRKHKEQYFS